MARDWKESDHPRHPGGSPGGSGGRFRDRVGSTGWAMRLNSMLGGRRGASEKTIGRAGGRSDLGDTSAADLRRTVAESDADFATVTNPDVGGFTSPQALAVRLEGLGDPDRARAVLGRLTPGQQAGIATHMKAPVHPDDEMTQGIIDKLFPEQYRARLRGLTNQDVADALAPERDRSVHDAYNSLVLDEAMEFLPALGEEDDDDFDEDLNAQIQIVINARNRGNKEDWDYAIDHLRRMLTLGYMDEDELPPLPPGRRSGSTGV